MLPRVTVGRAQGLISLFQLLSHHGGSCLSLELVDQGMGLLGAILEVSLPHMGILPVFQAFLKHPGQKVSLMCTLTHSTVVKTSDSSLLPLLTIWFLIKSDSCNLTDLKLFLSEMSRSMLSFHF